MSCGFMRLRPWPNVGSCSQQACPSLGSKGGPITQPKYTLYGSRTLFLNSGLPEAAIQDSLKPLEVHWSLSGSPSAKGFGPATLFPEGPDA